MFSELLLNRTRLQKYVNVLLASYPAGRNECQTGQRLNKREGFSKYYEPYVEQYCSLLVYFQFF